MKEENRPNAAMIDPHTESGRPALPLSMVRAGEQVRVKSISGKDDSKRFIRHLGLIEGAELTVVTETNGNVIVTIKGTRLAISKAMARRVMTY
ncbi:FeoA family protein [Sporolactobacillus spathodeae]|uniref:Ferrous iron transport protein A n=1 Tax=Sporolactobacillus spathodeae TaxID=1465502 RepID=A0ABS2QBK4_9BACL|nr:FeoA family protein [Sporolactobacillus spathodeae]MBM7659192.1 ferrous iron transport protein A [Sporolactobacillus spathodeae]